MKFFCNVDPEGQIKNFIMGENILDPDNEYTFHMNISHLGIKEFNPLEYEVLVSEQKLKKKNNIITS